MKSTNILSILNSSKAYIWILIGAVTAPLVLFLLSYILENPELRKIPLLLILMLVGAVVSLISYKIIPYESHSRIKKAAIFIVGIILYILSIFAVFYFLDYDEFD